MKIFLVITERDGKTTKKPGETSTKIIRSEIRFAAKNIQAVWKDLEKPPRMISEDQTLIGIYEESPAIIILGEKL